MCTQQRQRRKYMRCEVVNDVFVRMFQSSRHVYSFFFFLFFIFSSLFFFSFGCLMKISEFQYMAIIRLKCDEYWLTVYSCTPQGIESNYEFVMYIFAYFDFAMVSFVKWRRALAVNILICNWFSFSFYFFLSWILSFLCRSFGKSTKSKLVS